MENYGVFIDGKFVNLSKTFNVINPADRSVFATVGIASTKESEDAIAAASRAFPKWSALLGKERASILRNLEKLLLENKEEFIRIISSENGKVRSEALAEIDYSISFISWFAEEAKRVYGDIVPKVSNADLFTYKEPIGVVAAITPWNFPLAMVARKIAPALAAGCCVVLKPSEETPVTSLKFAELCQKAGFPDGVVNVVCGDVEAIGESLTKNPEVRMLSFTGSTKVGKMLAEKCASTVKRVSMELGGNAPFIVFDDADIDAAVEGVKASKLRNGGQSCICVNRIYVHKNIKAQFVSKLKKSFEGIVVGKSTNEKAHLGPMINDQSTAKIQSLLDDCKSKGSEVLFSVDITDLAGKGCFFPPTIIVNKSNNTEIEKTEIFGPIASIFEFDNEDEIIARANNTNYGLAAYFYTEDRKRIARVSRVLQYGMVAVNHVALSTEVTSFGGVKESGLGREGGRHGMEEFLEEKFVSII